LSEETGSELFGFRDQGGSPRPTEREEISVKVRSGAGAQKRASKKCDMLTRLWVAGVKKSRMPKFGIEKLGPCLQRPSKEYRRACHGRGGN